MISTDNVPTGVAMLFDASDYASFTISSGAVSQWNDKSGNARHLAQSTAGYRPTVDAGGVLFDGTDDHLSWTVSGTFFNNISGATLIVVTRGTKQAGTGLVAVTTNAGTGSRHSARFWNSAANSLAFVSRSNDTTNCALEFNDRHHVASIATMVGRASYSTGILYGSIDMGVEGITVISPVQNTPATNALRVVAGSNVSMAAGFMGGYIYAIAVWQTLLPLEQACNAAYIMGANFGHTPAPAHTIYAFTAPSHVTLQAGSSIEFDLPDGATPYYAGWRVKPTNCTAAVSGLTVTVTSTGAAPAGGELVITNRAGNVALVKVSITS